MARGRGRSNPFGEEATPPAAPSRLTCDCGSILVDGVCRESSGYPATSACPFACPICRGPLAWSGACERCHGCTSGRREDWTFPGARYELEKGHWQRVERVTGRAACAPEENLAGLAEVRAAFEGSLLTRTRLGLPPVDPRVRDEVARLARAGR